MGIVQPYSYIISSFHSKFQFSYSESQTKTAIKIQFYMILMVCGFSPLSIFKIKFKKPKHTDQGE